VRHDKISKYKIKVAFSFVSPFFSCLNEQDHDLKVLISSFVQHM